MATRKPDWADRQMQKALKTWNPSEAWLPHFTKELRKHHRRVVRVVKALQGYFQGSFIMLPREKGDWIARLDILDKLEEMTK